MTSEVCDICNSKFDNLLRKECGGTCLLCMAAFGDTDCALEVAERLSKLMVKNLKFRDRYGYETSKLRNPTNLPNDYARCSGNPEKQICQTCERFKQIERDKATKPYQVSYMDALPVGDRCDYKLVFK